MEISPPGVCLVAFRRGFPAVCVRLPPGTLAPGWAECPDGLLLGPARVLPGRHRSADEGAYLCPPGGSGLPPRWHRSAPGGSRGISLAGIPDKNLFDFCSGLFREFFSRMFFRFREEDSGLSDERSREERPERDSKETWLNCLNAKFKQVLNIRCVSL